MDNEKIITNFLEGLKSFLDKEKTLLEVNNIHEESISSKLMCHLSQYFSQYDVDCEYNKQGDNPKELEGNKIRTDIVVHRRKMHEYNLLIIEIKKNSESNKDITRIEKMTQQSGQYKYKLGIHLVFDLQNKKIKLFVYKDSKSIFKKNISFGKIMDLKFRQLLISKVVKVV